MPAWRAGQRRPEIMDRSGSGSQRFGAASTVRGRLDLSSCMALSKVAIVGRPNVGKSSLLNRLARRRVSIVDPTPGVTRDRVSAIVELDAPTETPPGTPARLIELIDTGGYGVYTAEGKRFDDAGADLAALTPEIESQIRVAIDAADLVLFVIDAQSGATGLDQSIADLLRRHAASPRVLAVANKVDDESWTAHGLEAARLGFGEPCCVSATSGYGLRRLREAVWQRVADPGDERPPDPEMKLAIVGKRNAGKSTLINALAGEARVIVSEIAGTTRDSIDVRFEIEGRAMLAIDTAGLRKRTSFADDVEYYAYHRMLAAVRRADVALLLIDATVPVSQVDQKLAQELQRQFKPTVIVVNKWDQVDPKVATPAGYLDYLTKELRGLDFAPIAFISAQRGEGLRDMVAMAFNLHRQAGHRESTGRLNAAVRDVLRQRGPSSKLGTRAKVLYVSQLDVHPPTIAMVVNEPSLFEGNYERYLLNELRDRLPYSEVPIRLVFSKRKRIELAPMQRAGRRRASRA
jgi:GTP-binding protein